MTTVRERIEARWHTDDTRPAHGSGGAVYVALEEALRAEWKAGNLIPKDEADARIAAAVAEAVAREKERCERACLLRAAGHDLRKKIIEPLMSGVLEAVAEEARACAAAIRSGEER